MEYVNYPVQARDYLDAMPRGSDRERERMATARADQG